MQQTNVGHTGVCIADQNQRSGRSKDTSAVFVAANIRITMPRPFTSKPSYSVSQECVEWTSYHGFKRRMVQVRHPGQSHGQNGLFQSISSNSEPASRLSLLWGGLSPTFEHVVSFVKDHFPRCLTKFLSRSLTRYTAQRNINFDGTGRARTHDFREDATRNSTIPRWSAYRRIMAPLVWYKLGRGLWWTARPAAHSSEQKIQIMADMLWGRGTVSRTDTYSLPSSRIGSLHLKRSMASTGISFGTQLIRFI